MTFLNSLRSDTYVYGAALLSERVISFFMLPVLINAVSVVEYAIWTQSIVTSGLMVTFILLGFNTAIVKFVPSFEDDPKLSYSLLKAMCLSILTWSIIISLLIHIFSLDISVLVFGNLTYQGFIPILILLIISEAIFDFIISLLRARRRIRTASVYILSLIHI